MTNVEEPDSKMLRLLLEVRKPEISISGAAGTGKTTLVKRVLATGLPVQLVAPTAAAARRLAQVTGRHASTIHSAIYTPPEEDEAGILYWPEPRPFDEEVRVVVVDESSMINHELAGHIRVAAAGKQIVWVGDGNQLPPVEGFPGVDLQQPDVLLTKVWRSSGCLAKFAADLLATKSAPELSQLLQNAHRTYSGVHRLDGTDWTPGVWRAAVKKQGASVMLITWTNDVRHAMNAQCREAAGYSPTELVPGHEELVMRSNQPGLGLVNGERLTLEAVIDQDDPDCPASLLYSRLVSPDTGRTVTCYLAPADFAADRREFREHRREESTAWYYRLLGEHKLQNPRWRNEVDKYRAAPPPRGQLIGPAASTAHAHFAYCLTCHSAQGSEADVVGVVWADWYQMKRNFEEAKSWLYTAVTRARQGVVLWLW